MRIWLDDERPIRDGFDIHVKTASAAIELLKTGKVEKISLDHDLGDAQNGTGYDVAKWIEEHAFHYSRGYDDGIPRIQTSIHSQNPVGCANMAAALRNADRYWGVAVGE
jgi:hypothetical protein